MKIGIPWAFARRPHMRAYFVAGIIVGYRQNVAAHSRNKHYLRACIRETRERASVCAHLAVWHLPG